MYGLIPWFVEGVRYSSKLAPFVFPFMHDWRLYGKSMTGPIQAKRSFQMPGRPCHNGQSLNRSLKWFARYSTEKYADPSVRQVSSSLEPQTVIAQGLTQEIPLTQRKTLPFFVGVKARLRARKPIELDEKDLAEKFVLGWGKGGQNVNKRANACFLTHVPSGLSVKVHAERHLEANRKIARERLRGLLDDQINGCCSLAAIRDERKKRRNRSRKPKTTAQTTDS